jgi:nucleotide-binding universal stress UspA family protein/hemerythrin-like domain-containing protein
MFTHLLVPVDDSDISIVNVGEAVKLARSFTPPLKLTFFHAGDDDGGSGDDGATPYDELRRHKVLADGAMVAVAPAAASRRDPPAPAGRGRLARAGAAAEAAGVPFATHATRGDRPAEAIARAAGDCGCDGIVMSSHRRSGIGALLTPSVAAKVMRLSTLPLLVTRAEAADMHREASRATALIQDEHRSLAAVLYALRHRVDDARARVEPLDRALVAELLLYLNEYPERRHHPKEEASLHRLLRLHGDRGRDLLHRIEAQHLREYELAAALQAACDACPDRAEGDDPALVRVDEALAALAAHVWDHMRLEEHDLLPLALELLTAQQWREVAEVFAGNQDPGFGEWSEEDFRRHFARAAAAAPLPEAQRGG